MVDKPPVYPKWADTDESDPVSGQSNVVKPPTAREDSGWTRREIPPRQWMNWLQRFTYRWILWLEQEADKVQPHIDDEDAVHGATAADTAGKIARRDANARMKAADPVDSQDVTTKSWVETLVQDPQNFDLSTNGYYIFPGGLIIQWGVSTGQVSVSTVTFPIPFPNACLNVQATAGKGDYLSTGEKNVAVDDFTTTSFSIRAESNERPPTWLAIGY